MTTEISSRKRSETEINASILEETAVPLLKNHVIYKCNLNDEMFKKYVLPLVENGNIELVDEEYYKRTGNGTILLQQIRDVLKQIGKNEGATA